MKNIAKSKILQTSDQFPDMPPKNLMKLCYLTSLLNLNEFQVVVSSPFATEIGKCFRSMIRNENIEKIRS